MSEGKRLIRGLALALAVVPPAAVFWVIYRYGVDAPYGDQFMLAPYLAHDHHVTFAELAALHNEHRILFPRLLMLGLARLTGWNIRAEMMASFAFALILLVVLWWRMRRDDGTLWALPVVSILIFTFAQYDSWLSGWQVQIVMNALAAGAGLALASSRELTAARLAGTVVLGVVAQYSFANGIFFWPIAAGVVWASQRRVVPVLVVLAAGAISTGLYLHDFERFGVPPSPFAHKVGYLLILLGQPVLPGAADLPGWKVITWRMWVAGILAIAGLLTVGITAWRSRTGDELRARSAFAVGLGAYAVLSGALTAQGRTFIGLGQATSPRYVAMSMFLWIGLVVLVARMRGWRWLLLPVGLLALAAQPPSLRTAIEYTASQRKLRDELRAGGPAQYIIIDPKFLASSLAVIKQEHLSCFRDLP